MDTSNRVIVIGAGPVGLCLSLALAQAGAEVCLIEMLGADNFLEQVSRAVLFAKRRRRDGTNADVFFSNLFGV